MAKHDIAELHQLQQLSLDEKICRTRARIKQWVDYYGLDHVYVSFSGGKDSTVLLDIARQMYPDIKAVFFDTSLEFPELREFVTTFDNVEFLKPKMNFRQTVERYGYPVITKEISDCVYGGRKYLAQLLREQLSEKYASSVGNGILSQESDIDWDRIAKTLEERGLGSGGSVLRLVRLMGILDKHNKINRNVSNKDRSQFTCKGYRFLLTAPFDISSHCCNIFKKNLSHKYNKKNNTHPITATLASESRIRTIKWLENGCNGFDLDEPVSNPMSFWFDNDVLMYVKENNLQICKVYGDVVEICPMYEQLSLTNLGVFDNQPVLATTACPRSGCIACGFGLHLEKRPNRLEYIDQVSNSKIRDFILRGGAFDENGLWKPDNRGLGFWFVYQWLNVHGGFEIYIPEYERYEREFGTCETKKHLLA